MPEFSVWSLFRRNALWLLRPRGLAVQNFAENIAMLSFVGAYSAATAAGVPIATTVAGFGLVLLAIIGGAGGVQVAGAMTGRGTIVTT